MGGCDRVRQLERRVAALRQQHDRSSIVLQESTFRVADLGDRAGGLEVGHHHGERLVAAVFPLTQSRNGDVVGRGTGQVIAADSLHGDDRAGIDQPTRLRDRSISLEVWLARTMQREDRPAVRARDRLGMESSVGRIGVLGSTRGAQR